ncbi:uncharacterized protein LOC116610183 [Nematostella vectensis]|uniref:uncharacterized protein LOC116610183 n=1 Tax=Nematostella vectensis TaxID=45351 RepID=UPI0020770DD8|nr:uncharacterized protein LOC116610183 [Nematostella vectensis]
MDEKAGSSLERVDLLEEGHGNNQKEGNGDKRYGLLKKRKSSDDKEDANSDARLGRLGRWLIKSKHVPNLALRLDGPDQSRDQEEEECSQDSPRPSQQQAEGDSLRPCGGSLNLASQYDNTEGSPQDEIRCSSKRRRSPSPRGGGVRIQSEECKEEPEQLGSEMKELRGESPHMRSCSDDHNEDEWWSERRNGGKWANYVLKLPHYLLCDPGRMERVFIQANQRTTEFPTKPINSYALAQSLLEYVMVDPDPESEEVSVELPRVKSACVLETHPCAVVMETPAPFPKIHYFQIEGSHKWMDEEMPPTFPNTIMGLSSRIFGKRMSREEYEDEDSVSPFREEYDSDFSECDC